MPILPLHRPIHDPSGHHVARIALPVAGVIAGTAAGFALAAVARRSGVIGPDSFELAPDDSTLDFDKGGVWLSRRARATEDHGPRLAGEELQEDAGEMAGLAATGIRPTFEVEDELAREVEAGAGSALEVDREPALSVPRA